MKKRKVLASAAVCCLVARRCCAPCGEQEAEKTDKIYVGVACYNQSDTFLGEMLECFKDRMNNFESSDLQAIVTIRDAAGLQRTQNDQGERAD